MNSEVIVGQANPPAYDLRGYSWWSWGCPFTTFLTPNSPLPDAMQSSGYCNYPYMQNPPCTTATGNFNFTMMQGARSRHAGGGVNVTFCDGSVKFIKNTIAVNIWQGLGSTQGNEVVSADTY
jgi:prepilin-type processing-associated H-X9-DG protein